MKNNKNNKPKEINTQTEIREKGFIIIDSKGEKKEVELIANKNFIQFLSSQNVSNEQIIDILILYKNLVIFAFDKTEKYILLSYSNDLEDESFQVKFYPDEDKSNKISKIFLHNEFLGEIIYEQLKSFNLQNPSAEFNDELEGENELYTAENL